jgi:hypothetical protein
MLKQLACLNPLPPPVDPSRESPLRAAHRTAVDLMIKSVSGQLRDDEYEGSVTGLISTALLKGRPVAANLRLALGQLLALHPSDRAKTINHVVNRTREGVEQRSDLFLIQQLIESLTTVISAYEGIAS